MSAEKGRAGVEVTVPGVSVAVSEQVANEITEFLGQVIGRPVADAVGLLGADWLRAKRYENAALLVQRVQERLRQRGLVVPSRAISATIAVPLLEAASLEEEPTLQQLWANLLTNAVDAASTFVTRSYIEVLKELSPVEAQIIDAVYSQIEVPHPRVGAIFVTQFLPERAERVREDAQPQEHPSPKDEVLVPLSNLSRLNIFKGGTTFDGGEHFGYIATTHFGAAFYRACA